MFFQVALGRILAIARFAGIHDSFRAGQILFSNIGRTYISLLRKTMPKILAVDQPHFFIALSGSAMSPALFYDSFFLSK